MSLDKSTQNDTVTIQVDGEAYGVDPKRTVLENLKSLGFDIPTLCFHPALKPSGSCKLCAVEVASKSGRPVAMLSCILPVKSGLAVKTQSELVQKARTNAFSNLLKMAPQSRRIRELAIKYGIDTGPPPDGCIRCRLCVRVCKEIVGPAALVLKKQNNVKSIFPVPDACIGCGTCANICPTGAIEIEDKENVRTISIRDQIIGRHPLETCEGCGKRFATPKYLQHISKRTAPHTDIKEHHKYCPTCAKLFSNRIKSFENRKQQMSRH
jgi:bidirectional [NiFe] hydrogenase diaphorase subunit